MQISSNNLNAFTSQRAARTDQDSRAKAHEASGLAEAGNEGKQQPAAGSVTGSEIASGVAADNDKLSNSAVDGIEQGGAIEAADNEEQKAGVASGTKKELSPAEDLQRAQVIRDLATRDREVRTHEQAHSSVAGSHGGSPSYQFKKGPDGVLYAVSGHVSVDVSAVEGDPEATIRKAQTVKRAALAPQDPSSADRSVAAKASALETAAKTDLVQQNAELLKQLATNEQSQQVGTLISVTA